MTSKIKKTDDLLLELANNMGFICLSDLRGLVDKRSLGLAIAQIPAGKYNFLEWKEAICYMDGSFLHQAWNFPSIEDAQRYFLNYKYREN